MDPILSKFEVRYNPMISELYDNYLLMAVYSISIYVIG